MLNQGGLYEDRHHNNHIEMGLSNIGLMYDPPSFTTNSLSQIPFGCNNNIQSPRSNNSNFTTTTVPSSSSLAPPPSDSPKQDNFNISSNHLLSLQKSSHINLW